MFNVLSVQNKQGFTLGKITSFTINQFVSSMEVCQ